MKNFAKTPFYLSKFALAVSCILGGTLCALPPRLVIAPVKAPLDQAATDKLLNGIEDALEAGKLRHVILELALEEGELKSLFRLGEYLFRLRERGVLTVSFIRAPADPATATIPASACMEIALAPGAKLGGLQKLNLNEQHKEKLLDWTNEFARPPVLFERMLEKGEALSAYHLSQPDKWLLLTRAQYKALDKNTRGKIVEERKLCEGDEPLLLNGEQAWRHKIVQYRPENRNDLLLRMNLLDLKENEIKELGKGGFAFTGGEAGEKIAQFFQSHFMRFLLILAGLLALFIEFQVPGLGIPGIIGLGCFALLFGTGFYTGYVDYTELGMFLAGLALIGLELLVIPGFGVAGIIGFVCLLVSLVLAMYKNETGEGIDADQLVNGMVTSLSAILCAFAGMFLCTKYFPKNLLVRRSRLIHQTGIQGTSWGPASDSAGKGPVGEASQGDSAGGEASSSGAKSPPWPVGAKGVTASSLRPAGKARVENRLLNVVAEADFIDAGTPVVVVKKSGPMIVVRPQEENR